MAQEIFGTDGIRGRVNQFPITADTCVAIARAAGRVFADGKVGARVLIGKDTRRSCYMIENALVAGFTSVGVNAVLTGPLPTPAIGMLTRSLRAELGVMISASHNPYHDNGIKFFGPNGAKIADEEQDAIEAACTRAISSSDVQSIGRATRMDGAPERYLEFVKRTFPASLRLDGLKVVVDAAHGAAFRVAPQLIWELGAEVIEVGCQPDGVNINDGCGSTAPELCRRTVIKTGADLGIMLDGDADRINLIDERGELVDGDQLMALIAFRAQRHGTLRGSSIVSTIMSNFGLEQVLSEKGVNLIRTAVGDRWVFEAMKRIGANIGGEQSGHIILSDFTTTGDGLIAGLQALAEIAEAQRPASEVLRVFTPMPQVLQNVRTEGAGTALHVPSVKAAITAARAEIGETGRLVVRASGTEPVIRLMAEGEDLPNLKRVVETLSRKICPEPDKLLASPSLKADPRPVNADKVGFGVHT